MSYPPPSGPRSSTPQSHPSLPARPPPPAFKPAFPSGPANGANRAASSAFTAFKPRTVATSNHQSWNSPSISAAPAPPSSFSSQTAAYPGANYPQQSQQAYQYPSQQGQQPYYSQDAYGQSAAAPMIHNPFAPSVAGQTSYDPEAEAQIAQWQAQYAAPADPNKDKTSTTGTPSVSAATANTAPATEKTKTVVRSGGGETWNDSTLLEWDPAHFRLFVGNLAGEVTDDSLLKAFSKYTSVQKARVIRDKRTTKSKGYGFISFSDGDQFFLAAKEMQGKYIGSHPVLLRRANTDVRATVQKDQGRGKGKGGKAGGGGGGGGAGGAGGGANTGAGIQKKQPKTKGGLKLLG